MAGENYECAEDTNRGIIGKAGGKTEPDPRRGRGKVRLQALPSPKVPKRVKFLLVGLGVYLASPLDIVPDAIPVLGYLDDAFVAAAALGLAARWLPRDVVDELWEGEVAFDEALKLLQGAVRNIMRRKKAG